MTQKVQGNLLFPLAQTCDITALETNLFVKERGMAESSQAIASLLNLARPGLLPGWDARETGGGELTVRLRSRGRFAVLMAQAAPVLEFLDGEHTLNEVASAVLEKAGSVRHQVILDSVARLHEAGLLEPMSGEVDGFLQEQLRLRAGSKVFGFLRAIAGFRLFAPVRYGGGSSPGESVQNWTMVFLGISLVGFVIGLTRMLAGPGSLHGQPSTFGQEPVTSLLLVLAGVVAALSARGVARAILLPMFGRTVYGVGIRFSVFIPHLDADGRDEVMMNRHERMGYRFALVGTALLPAAACAILSGVFKSAPLYFVGLGAHLALLAHLSPLWTSDLSVLLEEITGTRLLRRKSARFLLMKLWRNVVKKGSPGRDEVVMIVSASLAMLHLFILVAVLAWLAPDTMDALSGALLNPVTPAVNKVLAIIMVAYLWVALLLGAIAVLAAVIGAFVQLVVPQQRATRPLEVVEAHTLSLDDLVEEVGAIPPFAGLPSELVRQTLSGGRLEKFRKGSVIVRQGDQGDTCYIVRSGDCAVELEDICGKKSIVGRLGAGGLFGEVALLESGDRKATVLAENDVEVIAIDGGVFMPLVESGGWDRQEVMDRVRLHSFLKKLALFKGLSAHHMAVVTRAVNLVRKEAGVDVVREGDTGQTMYVIFRGKVEVLKEGGGKVAELGEGDYFAEIALVTGKPRTATVRCMEPCVLAELPSSVYGEVLVEEFSTGVMLDMEIEARLESLSLL